MGEAPEKQTVAQQADEKVAEAGNVEAAHLRVWRNLNWAKWALRRTGDKAPSAARKKSLTANVKRLTPLEKELKKRRDAERKAAKSG